MGGCAGIRLCHALQFAAAQRCSGSSMQGTARFMAAANAGAMEKEMTLHA
jgi:hypothetical protein